MHYTEKRHCHTAILEGILNSVWYQKLFEKRSESFSKNIYAYCFDIPFEEALIRHRQKTNSVEFGEKEMRKWWNEKDLIKIIPEVLLNEKLSCDEIVDIIYRKVVSDNKNSNPTSILV